MHSGSMAAQWDTILNHEARRWRVLSMIPRLASPHETLIAHSQLNKGQTAFTAGIYRPSDEQVKLYLDHGKFVFAGESACALGVCRMVREAEGVQQEDGRKLFGGLGGSARNPHDHMHMDELLRSLYRSASAGAHRTIRTMERDKIRSSNAFSSSITQHPSTLLHPHNTDQPAYTRSRLTLSAVAAAATRTTAHTPTDADPRTTAVAALALPIPVTTTAAATDQRVTAHRVATLGGVGVVTILTGGEVSHLSDCSDCSGRDWLPGCWFAYS